jgi:MYXO-CTERM domain-containing protein
MRRTRSLLVLVGLGALLTVLVAAPAQAAGYRYWSFWQITDGRWTYATEGPATARPADGSVHGFRFSVSEDSGDSAKPRTAPDFAAICAKTPAKDGTKRIALVIDPGTATDAPRGETPPARRTACVQTDETATTAEALARVAKPLRYNSQALLCAISGYPKSGCGEQVSERESASASEPEPDEGPSVGLYAGLAAVLALAAATVWQSRRRKR